MRQAAAAGLRETVTLRSDWPGMCLIFRIDLHGNGSRNPPSATRRGATASDEAAQRGRGLGVALGVHDERAGQRARPLLQGHVLPGEHHAADLAAAVRDSILALGGQLDLTMGGRPVQLELGEGGFSHRRTLYGMVDRRNLPELYSQFDFANPDITTGKRYETTVPQQALFMMNSPLVVELARKLVNERAFKVLVGEDAKDKIPLRTHLPARANRGRNQAGPGFHRRLARPRTNHRRRPRKAARAARQNRMKPGQKGGGRAMTMVSLGPGQIRPIGTWVKYAHALLQTNEAIFIN